MTGLPPASYDVSATSAGFATVLSKAVVIGIGHTMEDNFTLPIASASTQVIVSSAAPVIETERGGQAGTIGTRLIEDLPISQRDYLTFALLVPGVGNSNVIAGDNDYRVQSTPQSGLSVYGSNGRGSSVTVDGGEANHDAGGVRLTVSQDAVDQLQINRNDYPAELGGASGAAINIVTKSGTNALHGGLFGFFRNSALDARSVRLQPGSPAWAALLTQCRGRAHQGPAQPSAVWRTLVLPSRRTRRSSFLLLSHSGKIRRIPCLC